MEGYESRCYHQPSPLTLDNNETDEHPDHETTPPTVSRKQPSLLHPLEDPTAPTVSIKQPPPFDEIKLIPTPFFFLPPLVINNNKPRTRHHNNQRVHKTIPHCPGRHHPSQSRLDGVSALKGGLLSRTDKHLLFGVIIGAIGMWAVGVTILLFYLLGRK
jgi:hypothetical protein